jgi:hypothetical protein
MRWQAVQHLHFPNGPVVPNQGYLARKTSYVLSIKSFILLAFVNAYESTAHYLRNLPVESHRLS